MHLLAIYAATLAIHDVELYVAHDVCGENNSYTA